MSKSVNSHSVNGSKLGRFPGDCNLVLPMTAQERVENMITHRAKIMAIFFVLSGQLSSSLPSAHSSTPSQAVALCQMVTLLKMSGLLHFIVASGGKCFLQSSKFSSEPSGHCAMPSQTSDARMQMLELRLHGTAPAPPWPHFDTYSLKEN